MSNADRHLAVKQKDRTMDNWNNGMNDEEDEQMMQTIEDCYGCVIMFFGLVILSLIIQNCF